MYLVVLVSIPLLNFTNHLMGVFTDFDKNYAMPNFIPLRSYPDNPLLFVNDVIRNKVTRHIHLPHAIDAKVFQRMLASNHMFDVAMLVFQI